TIATWQRPTGGTIPHHCGYTSNTLIQAYLYAVDKMGGGPVGLGSDLNGFAGLPGPRFGPDECPGGFVPFSAGWPPVLYPFVAAATGIHMGQSLIGMRVFDFNMDGLAHVGMLPDLIADFAAQGATPEDLAPLLESAE